MKQVKLPVIRMMRLKSLGMAACIFLLAACSANNAPSFSTSGALHGPPKGMAQLVLYYPSSSFWMGHTAHVDTGGAATACDLKAGTFFIRDITPGSKTTISASLCGRPGMSQLVIRTAVGGRYYIRITPNDDTLTGRIGNYGMTKPREKLNYGGPFRLDIMDATAAMAELQPLRPCAGCE